MGGVGVVWMGKSAEKKCTDIGIICGWVAIIRRWVEFG